MVINSVSNVCYAGHDAQRNDLITRDNILTEIEEVAPRLPAMIVSRVDVKRKSETSGGVTVPTNTTPYENETFAFATTSTLAAASGKLGQLMA